MNKIKSHARGFLVSAVLAVLTIPALAQEADFQRLEHVLGWSWQHNPRLAAARAELKAVRERLPQAQSFWKPTVTANGNITHLDIDPGNFGDGTTSKGVGVDLTEPVYRGGRTVAATEAAKHIISAQQLFLEQEEQDVLLDVATAYMNVVRDRTLLKLSENNRDVIARQLEATRDRFEVGEITRTDVSQATARLARAEADSTRARGDLAASRAEYEQLIGMMPDELGQPQVNFPLPPTINEAIEKADQSNPEILASIAIHQASLKDIDEAFGGLLPELSVFAGWGREYDPQPGFLDDTTTKTLGVRASVPLYTGGLRRSQVRQATHTAERRFQQVSEVKRRIRQELITNWEDLRAAKAEIRSRQSQVEASQVAQEGVHQEAELGARTILDSLDADQEYLDAQAALVTARRNEIVATFALSKTLGLLTPEVIGFPREEGN